MHDSENLDLRYLRDMPLGLSERIMARFLISAYALRNPDATDRLLDALTDPRVEWLPLVDWTPAEMRDAAGCISDLWPDATAHLVQLAASIEQQDTDRADARYAGRVL